MDPRRRPGPRRRRAGPGGCTWRPRCPPRARCRSSAARCAGHGPPPRRSSGYGKARPPPILGSVRFPSPPGPEGAVTDRGPWLGNVMRSRWNDLDLGHGLLAWRQELLDALQVVLARHGDHDAFRRHQRRRRRGHRRPEGDLLPPRLLLAHRVRGRSRPPAPRHPRRRGPDESFADRRSGPPWPTWLRQGSPRCRRRPAHGGGRRAGPRSGPTAPRPWPRDSEPPRSW